MNYAVKILEEAISIRKSAIKYSKSGSPQAEKCKEELKDLMKAVEVLKESDLK